MKYDILHTADWHLWHKHKYTHLIAGKHWDAFCEAKLNVLRMFIEFVQQNKVEHFIVAGDIFEHFNPIEPLRKEFVKIITEISKNVQHVHIILGNHDQYKGQAALETADFMYKQMSYSPVIYGDDAFIICPQYDSPHILIRHCSVEGFMMKDKFFETGDAVQKKMSFDEKFKLILLGHYHKNQNDERFFYCGSPYPCNFGEEKNIGTFNVYNFDKDKLTYKIIPIDGIMFHTNSVGTGNYQIIRLQEECSPDKEAAVRRALTDRQAELLKDKRILDCIVEIKVIRDSLKGKTEKDIEVTDYRKLIKALKVEKPFEEYIEHKFASALEEK